MDFYKIYGQIICFIKMNDYLCGIKLKKKR